MPFATLDIVTAKHKTQISTIKILKLNIMITVKNKTLNPANSVFDPFFFGAPAANRGQRKQHTKKVLHNVIKNENDFVIQLAVPGYTKENFDINVEDAILKITLNKEIKDEKKYIRKEFDFSDVKKSFHLSKDINVEKISATYDMGILNIELPLKEKVVKQISIK